MHNAKVRPGWQKENFVPGTQYCKQVAQKWDQIQVAGEAEIKMAVEILGDQFIQGSAERRFCFSGKCDWLEVGLELQSSKLGFSVIQS